MFEIKTEQEETAYRLGYRDGWAATCNKVLKMVLWGFSAGRIRWKMKDHWDRALLSWSQEESPKIDEPAPGFGL